MRTPRPSMVWWRDDAITIDGHTVEFNDYKKHLQTKAMELELFVEDEVLFGLYSLDDIEALFHVSVLQDMGDETTVGYGILLDTQPGNETMDNPQSGKILEHMFHHGVLGLRRTQASNIVFDKALAVDWVMKIHLAWRMFQPLAHITQGIPGRGTEESLFSPMNTKTTRRHVFFEPTVGTSGFSTNYHKGANITGTFKHIFRILPFRIFLVLYVLIRLIRPIELSVLFDYFIEAHRRAATVVAYKEHVYASFGRAWTSPVDISPNLSIWFKNCLGFEMGIRRYRHFATAVQRHFPETNYQLEPTVKESLIIAADLMGGHTPQVSELHYARLEKTNSATPTMKTLFFQICKDWHRLHGFQTTYQGSGRTKFVPWDPTKHPSDSGANLNVVHAELPAASLPDIDSSRTKKVRTRKWKPLPVAGLPFRLSAPAKRLPSSRTAKTKGRQALTKVIKSLNESDWVFDSAEDDDEELSVANLDSDHSSTGKTSPVSPSMDFATAAMAAVNIGQTDIPGDNQPQRTAMTTHSKSEGLPIVLAASSKLPAKIINQQPIVAEASRLKNQRLENLPPSTSELPNIVVKHRRLGPGNLK